MGSGWDEEDLKEDLMNLDKDPTEREERYYELFEKYYEEVINLKEEDYPKPLKKFGERLLL